MAKKNVMKLKCSAINQNSNGGSVILSLNEKKITGAAGQPPAITMRTAVTINFTDPHEAASFVHGNAYTVTVEG